MAGLTNGRERPHSSSKSNLVLVSAISPARPIRFNPPPPSRRPLPASQKSRGPPRSHYDGPIVRDRSSLFGDSSRGSGRGGVVSRRFIARKSVLSAKLFVVAKKISPLKPRAGERSNNVSKDRESSEEFRNYYVPVELELVTSVSDEKLCPRMVYAVERKIEGKIHGVTWSSEERFGIENENEIQKLARNREGARQSWLFGSERARTRAYGFYAGKLSVSRRFRRRHNAAELLADHRASSRASRAGKTGKPFLLALVRFGFQCGRLTFPLRPGDTLARKERRDGKKKHRITRSESHARIDLLLP